VIADRKWHSVCGSRVHPGRHGWRGGSQGGEPVASEPSRDLRSALMAPGHSRRRRRRHPSVGPPAVQPRKARRQRDTRVELVLRLQLAAGIGVEFPVGLADRPTAACLPGHASMPRRPPGVPLVEPARLVHAGHRRPLHDNRLLGGRGPDLEDRRDGDHDRGGDDGRTKSHGIRTPGKHAAARRSKPWGSSTWLCPGIHRPCRPFGLDRSGKPCGRGRLVTR